MKVTFYFVRHGETLFNRKGRIQGVCDSPLTGNGIKQAEKAGEALKEIYFDRAYVSPSERAMDTAELILNGRKTEADFICGAVVRAAQDQGLQVPVQETILRLVHAMEER